MMRRALLLLAIAACGHPQPTNVPENMTMNDAKEPEQPPPVVAARTPTEWSLEVTRTQGARSARSDVILTIAPSTAQPAPHAGVASARAWLALAKQGLELGAASDAVAAARHGIADLGDRYRPKLIKDDTGLHLLDANGMVAAGKMSEGSQELISILEARIGMYFVRYKQEVRPD